ncbi:MAG: MotA/TolQ/ExbB proton channel family protein [Bdellovibrionales bacterium]
MKDRIFAIAHFADSAVLYLLIFLSFVSLFLIIERHLRLGKIAKVSKAERRRLEVALRDQEDLSEIELNPKSLEGEVWNRAMVHMKKYGSAGLEEQFNTYVQFEQPRLERSLTFLATVGSNAPYIGLFGTVLGIMKSFNDLAQASSAGQQTVMAGISAALIATAAGLLVAIPNILAYNYFQKKVKAIITGIETFREAAVAYAKAKGV